MIGMPLPVAIPLGCGHSPLAPPQGEENSLHWAVIYLFKRLVAFSGGGGWHGMAWHGHGMETCPCVYGGMAWPGGGTGGTRLSRALPIMKTFWEELWEACRHASCLWPLWRGKMHETVWSLVSESFPVVAMHEAGWPVLLWEGAALSGLFSPPRKEEKALCPCA